jgi:hypothetical protein
MESNSNMRMLTRLGYAVFVMDIERVSSWLGLRSFNFHVHIHLGLSAIDRPLGKNPELGRSSVLLPTVAMANAE